jgi:hypothetical protein
MQTALARIVLAVHFVCLATGEMTGDAGHIKPPTIQIQQPAQDAEFDNDVGLPIHIWSSSNAEEGSTVVIRLGREHVPFANKTQISMPGNAGFVTLGGSSPGTYEVEVQRLAANGTMIESVKSTFVLRMGTEQFFHTMKNRIFDGEEKVDWDTFATELMSEYLKRDCPKGWMERVISEATTLDSARMLCTDHCRTLLHLAIRTMEHHITTSHAYHEGKPLEMRKWEHPRRQDYVQMITQVHAAVPKAINVLDEHGYSVLHYASYTGMYIAVRLLLHLGADPNVQSKMTARERPLHVAVGSNDVELALELLAYGADPLLTDAWNRTPLMLSSTLDMGEMSTVLIRKGAPCHGEHHAEEGEVELSGADERLMSMVLSNDVEGIRQAAESGAMGKRVLESIDAPLGRYHTMLSAATDVGSTDVALYLLSIGAHCEKPSYTIPGVQPTQPQEHWGGWLMNSSMEYMPPKGTEIATVTIDQMDPDRWLRDFHWIRRPILIKNVVNDSWPAVKRWERKNLVEGFGTESVITSRVPHGYGTYGFKFKSMKEHIEYMREDNHSLPMYSFDIWLMAKRPELKTHYKVPFERLPDLVEFGTRSQFITGPRRSGTPMHVHCTAINIAVYGRKRWFLYPPANSGTDSLHPIEWIQSEQYKQRAPIEVLQEAGDLIYVPALWGHAVLNLEETVAFALEFNPGFCQMNHYTKTM